MHCNALESRKSASPRERDRNSEINHECTLMDANEEKLLLKQEVFQIVGCAIEVLNALGHRLIEKPYENALVVEFGLRNIPFRQQPSFDVLYKGHTIGLFVPDL